MSDKVVAQDEAVGWGVAEKHAGIDIKCVAEPADESEG